MKAALTQLHLDQILCANRFLKKLFMAALWNRAGHYIFAVWFLFLLSSFFLSFFSSPNLNIHCSIVSYLPCPCIDTTAIWLTVLITIWLLTVWLSHNQDALVHYQLTDYKAARHHKSQIADVLWLTGLLSRVIWVLRVSPEFLHAACRSCSLTNSVEALKVTQSTCWASSVSK